MNGYLLSLSVVKMKGADSGHEQLYNRLGIVVSLSGCSGHLFLEISCVTGRECQTDSQCLLPLYKYLHITSCLARFQHRAINNCVCEATSHKHGPKS